MHRIRLRIDSKVGLPVVALGRAVTYKTNLPHEPGSRIPSTVYRVRS